MGEIKDTENEYCVIKRESIFQGSAYSVIAVRKTDGKILLSVEISENKKKADDFCNFLNRNRISVVHFYDVLEDYFYC